MKVTVLKVDGPIRRRSRRDRFWVKPDLLHEKWMVIRLNVDGPEVDRLKLLVWFFETKFGIKKKLHEMRTQSMTRWFISDEHRFPTLLHVNFVTRPKPSSINASRYRVTLLEPEIAGSFGMNGTFSIRVRFRTVSYVFGFNA